MAVALAIWVAAVGVAAPASAHQSVFLESDDAAPRSGPLLLDGTVAYAVRAEVSRGQERGFRFRLQDGDRLALQLLIFDEPPASMLTPRELPQVMLIDPKGRHSTLPFTERTEFFEPYSKRQYLFLSRIERSAVPGTYRVLIRGRSASPVDATVALGYREVPGTIIG